MLWKSRLNNYVGDDRGRDKLTLLRVPSLTDSIQTAYDKRSEEVKRVVYSKLPPEITHLATTFPFSSINNSKETIIAAIESRLPTYERATALVEAYIQHIACFFRPVRREQIMEELIPKFFKRNRNARYEPVSSSSPRYGSEIFEHQLALLFAVFACGAAGDLTLEACNEEGETYRQLARSALSLHSVFEGTSLATVQAVALIGAFDVFSASMETIETPFKMLTLALSLGITVSSRNKRAIGIKFDLMPLLDRTSYVI